MATDLYRYSFLFFFRFLLTFHQHVFSRLAHLRIIKFHFLLALMSLSLNTSPAQRFLKCHFTFLTQSKTTLFFVDNAITIDTFQRIDFRKFTSLHFYCRFQLQRARRKNMRDIHLAFSRSRSLIWWWNVVISCIQLSFLKSRNLGHTVQVGHTSTH